ncbi:MAG: Cell division-associated, ATP-dependent zinc metalloprotease FtsH [Ktedonobacterales bacterium]|jgi:cell division protease FtsH|nr:MAG: Cell division-associated, ATP-dependent zinc metalloprotease FtsH [Ktedonobacterales bacterium]
MVNPFRSRTGFLLLLVVTLAAIFVVFGIQQHNQPREVDLSTLLADLRGDITHHRLDTLTLSGNTLVLERQSEPTEQASVSSTFQVSDLKRDYNIDYANPSILRYRIAAQGAQVFWGNLLGTLLPVALVIGAFLFIMRQAQGANNQAISFGKSRARMFLSNKPVVTFADVAGVDEAKQELQEIVEFLKYPEKFAKLGARIPKGVLLMGPPGTGKTLVARAVAGEAGVPFFSISGSEFVEMFVGVGASRVRDLFEQAKRHSPCIIFVDEIDAVGRQRGAGLGGSHDEREQTLNQMLVEMDGFDPNTSVIVMAATNRPDVLDPALLRPGRFDRQVTLDRPDVRGRAAILEVHGRGKPLDSSISLETLARQTAGFSGADLQNLLNEGAILAARAGQASITMRELEEAIDRVAAGPERKSRIISEREKAVTAYHEIGHALVARALPNCDPVHKVSIVARGPMGGYTRLLPSEERYLWSKAQFEDFLAFALGGHAAERLIFNDVTTGASNDIDRVTEMARKMVTEYGMSDRLGPIALGKKDEMVFLGREIGEERNYSEQTAREIDEEVRAIIHRAYETAERVLTEHHARLVLMSEKLIQSETLEGQEFERLFVSPLSEEHIYLPLPASAAATAPPTEDTSAQFSADGLGGTPSARGPRT